MTQHSVAGATTTHTDGIAAGGALTGIEEGALTHGLFHSVAPAHHLFGQLLALPGADYGAAGAGERDENDGKCSSSGFHDLRLTVPMRLCRLQLAAVVAFFLLPLTSATAQSSVSTAVSVYADDDDTEVITSVTRGSVQAWEGGTVSASYLVDVVTSASVDVVSRATPGFSENRHGITASVSQEVGDHTLRANYGFSIEVGTGTRTARPANRVSDYVGHGVGLGGDFTFFQENTIISMDYALELGAVGRADDENFERSLTTHSLDLRLAQVLSKTTLGTIGWTVIVQDGYNAKPYRFARVGNVNGGICAVCPPETHPDFRLRNAVFVALKQHLFAESAIEFRYRFYFDDWSVMAHTAEMQLHLGWNQYFGMRLRYRLHHQGAASFWEDVYTETKRYMTADRELSPLTGHLTGLLFFGRISDVIGLKAIEPYAKVDIFRYDYHDFSLLETRLGIVGEIGLGVEF